MKGETSSMIGYALLGLATIPIALTAGEIVLVIIGNPRIATFVENIAGPICHHMPDRTLEFAGEYLPVCARCTGFYTGVLCAVPALLLSSRRRIRVLASGLGGVCGMAVVLWALEILGWIITSNRERVLLGVPLGLFPEWCLLFSGLLLIGANRLRPRMTLRN